MRLFVFSRDLRGPSFECVCEEQARMMIMMHPDDYQYYAHIYFDHEYKVWRWHSYHLNVDGKIEPTLNKSALYPRRLRHLGLA